MAIPQNKTNKVNESKNSFIHFIQNDGNHNEKLSIFAIFFIAWSTEL